MRVTRVYGLPIDFLNVFNCTQYDGVFIVNNITGTRYKTAKKSEKSRDRVSRSVLLTVHQRCLRLFEIQNLFDTVQLTRDHTRPADLGGSVPISSFVSRFPEKS